MLINRKSKKLTKPVVDNLHTDSAEIQQCHHKQIQITSYPSLQYLFGASLIAISIFLLYSANGGQNGIEGFKDRKWWQFMAALLPMVLGFCFLLACQVETVSISRRDNWIISTKTRFFCYVAENLKKQFTDLTGISVVKTGVQKANVAMTQYHIVLSFKTFDELIVLRCMSQERILSYFEDIRRIFGQYQISQKRVVIQNLIN